MKRRSYTISIDDPCKQEWSSMATSDKGKFCSHCSKDVIDFSKLTDKEIIKIIEGSTEKLCGKFNKEQLNRLIIETGGQSANPGLYKILTALLLMASAGNLPAQVKQSEAQIVSSINNASLRTDNKQQAQPSDSLKNVIQGRVFDAETKDTIMTAVIFIKNTNVAAITDIDGYFKLILPESFNDTITLQIEFPEYGPVEFLLYKKDLPITKDFFLFPNKSRTSVMGGMSFRSTEIKVIQGVNTTGGVPVPPVITTRKGEIVNTNIGEPVIVSPTPKNCE